MVAILTVVAIVLDYSNLRNTRQDNKLVADVVATAGVQALAPDAIPRPWRGVCSALAYLRANKPDLTLTVTYRDGAANPIAGTPCTSLATQVCEPNMPATWAWIHVVSDAFVGDIRSGYVTPDATFAEDAAAYSGDDGVPAQGGCDQLAVIIDNHDEPLFGGIVGASGYASTSRTVGRVRITMEGEGVPAFLMLERTACDALSEQVGSGELGIVVDAASPTDPGIIHVDSSGSPSAGCDGNNNPGGWAVYSSGTGGPKIVAMPAANGTAGIIAIHALQVGSPPTAYGGSTAAGLSPPPGPARVVSRKPVDEKYNPASAPTISNLHAAAYIDATRSSAPDGTWRTLGCGDNNGTFTEVKIFVGCPGGYSPNNATFSNAQQVIFNGPVAVGNNKSLFMPGARRIVVGGTTSGGLTVAGGGRLGINSASFAADDGATSTACNGREGPAWTQTTELVIFGGRATGGDQGALNVTGRGALCQTFAYLAGQKIAANAVYTPQQTTDGVYDPSCLLAKPCAKVNNNSAHLVVAGLLRWSAPNQLTSQPVSGAVGIEDLALWSETSTLSEVRAGGNLQARGVYFLPNDRVEMRSPASATPQDAQFIARSLQLMQGELRMRPTPRNAVQIPVLGGVGLVR
jgi:hypothetical protein